MDGPPEDRAPKPKPKGEQTAAMTVLCSLPWDEAWLLRGRLRADGIDAAVSPDDFTAYTYTPRRLFDVVVPQNEVEEARRIAAELGEFGEP